MYYPSLFNGDFASDLFDEVLNFPVDYGKRLRNEMLDKSSLDTIRQISKQSLKMAIL